MTQKPETTQSLKFCLENERIFVSLYLQYAVCFSLIRSWSL